MNEGKQFEVLLDRERIRGASRMIPEGTDAASITEAQVDEVIHQVRFLAEKWGISIKAIARAIGMSPSVITDVLNRRYRSDHRAIILQLDAWLEAETKRRETAETKPYVLTSVAREIQTVAQLAIQLKTIGAIYGPDTSGIGKTTSLEAIALETPGTVMITVEKQHAHATGLWRAIAEQMRVPNFAHKPTGTLYDEIKARLKNTPRLLIIDQIHNFRGGRNDRPLYLLTDLYDATNKAPQLWCGTADMATYLNTGAKRRNDESLAQVRRRIGIQRDLMQRTRPIADGGRDEPLFTVEDIRKVFASNKVRISPESIHRLWQLACLPDDGALGLANNVVRVATILAEFSGKKSIDVQLIMASLQDCVQPTVFKRVSLIVENETPIRAMKVSG